MRRESIAFWPADSRVSLEAYLPEEGQNLPAVIVLPGGAYFALSDREGAQVAKYFAEKGFAAFVLRYSTMHPSFDAPETLINPHTRFPEPLHQLAVAIKLLRDRAEDFGLDPKRICLMGFSAGGHLAANYCNVWASDEVSEALGLEPEEIRPAAAILCYAATRLSRTSKTMNLAVFGPRDSYPQELLDSYCAAENVNRCTPPTFLWHTVTDRMVPVTQTYEMAKALAEEGIIHEVHIFSEGDHAMGLSDGLPAEPWKDLAIRFIERNT